MAKTARTPAAPKVDVKKLQQELSVNRAMAVSPNGRIVVDDPDLKMRTGDELKAELEAGLRRDLSDFNPLRVLRERK